MPETKTPSAESEKSGRDYSDTLQLPKTDFPMRAGLPKREPEWLANWERMDLYGRLREQGKSREKFILHDGPPYANGHLHTGHALNKILKDFVVKSQQMMGKDANYVPGWDCHGLPIEWKIEEKYRAAGKNKDEVPVNEFRQECREFAGKWIDVQREEFKRLGVIGHWDDPYTTMAFRAEAQIAREFMKFVMNGGLYRGSKPVMWSVAEKTALAEAEVEYHDHVSTTIHVKFPVVEGPDALKNASVVIWTTTPWTIPGNRAVAYSEDISYGLYKVDGVAETSAAQMGEVIVLADSLAEEVQQAAQIESWTRTGDAPSLDGVVLAHPFRGKGYDFDVPLLSGGFVTEETGTGFVHIAPGHGQDDFELWRDKIGTEVPFTVDEGGAYYDHVPLFAGLKVLRTEGKKAGKDGDANGAVIRELFDSERILAKGRLDHTYPHSWRSKMPLIFRNTPQWFVSMETNDLRKRALEAIEQVRWVPDQGKKRIQSMVELRPDWVVSRQRAWGVPLTCFVHKETGELLRDDAVNERIAQIFEEEGADAWFNSDASRFLGNDHKAEDYEMVTDILDVWFDSGSTHAFVLEDRDDLAAPADLYLEGSDQHRGWFQSSLLESCGTRGVAPYKAVLTHGFLLDEKGFKMSKSKGNSVEPQDVIKQSGADILRLWVASSDFKDDLSIGPEILKANVDSYRKLRNTFKYLLGNLHDFEESERVALEEMPELERWVLHRLTELDGLVRQAYNDFDFRLIFSQLFNFCTLDLSALYFDIRKDSLYCDRPDNLTRRSCRTVLDHLYNALIAWFAPILSFTAEEAWLMRHPDQDNSIHLQAFPEIPSEWRDESLAAKWAIVRRLRRVVTGALEVERREKRIGSSLEAAPVVYVQDPAYVTAMSGLDLAEIVITSQAELVEGPAPGGAFTLDEVESVAVVPKLAQGKKCQRSWKILADVGSDLRFPDLSPRDADAVAYFDSRTG